MLKDFINSALCVKAVRGSLFCYNAFLQSDGNFVSEISLFNRGWASRF